MSYWQCFFLKISCYFSLKFLAWATLNLEALDQKENCALFRIAVRPLLQRAACIPTVRLCPCVILRPGDRTPGSRRAGSMPLRHSSQYHSPFTLGDRRCWGRACAWRTGMTGVGKVWKHRSLGWTSVGRLPGNIYSQH